MARIRFDVTPEGVTMEGEGFVGTACQTAMFPYVEAFGITDPQQAVVETKPEFYEQQDEQISGG